MDYTQDTNALHKKIRRLNTANTFRKIIKAMKPQLTDNAPVSRAQMLEAFEAEFATQLDMTKSDSVHHVYKDPLTNAILYAFRTTVKEGRRALVGIGKNREVINEMFDGKIQGPFIVGCVVEDNTVQFGYRPRRHTSAVSATKEAKNLKERFGKGFAVFAKIGEIRGPELKIEESKQQERGKKAQPSINASRVLKSLGDYMMANLGKLEPGTPRGLAFNVDEGGVWQVLGEGLTVIGSGRHDQCIHFINDWLRAKGFGLMPPETDQETTEEIKALREKPVPPPLRIVSEGWLPPKFDNK